MKQSNKKIGIAGELIASQYFENQGYTIIEKNYRYRKAEIDLILQKENILVFVEVKFRSSAQFGLPEEKVSENQKNLILNAAEHFIFEKNWRKDIRFDILAILNADALEITHFEDAFY